MTFRSKFCKYVWVFWLGGSLNYVEAFHSVYDLIQEEDFKSIDAESLATHVEDHLGQDWDAHESEDGTGIEVFNYNSGAFFWVRKSQHGFWYIDC